MVRAILAGRKTQTRRELSERARIGYPHSEIARACPTTFETTGNLAFALACPHGVVGDRLWVRERIEVLDREGGASRYVADRELTRADAWPWKRDSLPSIHCPRGLSRITLEITDVRVQRVQDISEEDAVAEGCSPSTVPGGFTVVQADGGSYWVGEDYHSVPKVGDVDDRGEDFRVTHVQHAPEKQIGTARDSFHSLWLSINGEGSWKHNPWVWALTFKRVEAA